MTIELASTRAIEKPWGRADLRPWSDLGRATGKIGEIWYERKDPTGREPSLLLKLLFTLEPLSVQVHPGDAYARSIGEAHGKSEAWYVVSAEPGGRIALGLDRRLTSEELRDAIADGSIAKRIAWRQVASGDVVDVPAGSIHAIGAGLVIAEIQQRSDMTFRLFDYGRSRALHVEQAVAVADAGPAPAGPLAKPLGRGRTLLVSSSHFILEKVDALPRSNWSIQAPHETWLLVLSGHVRVGPLNVGPCEAAFLEDEETTVQAGVLGMQALIAYEASRPDITMLRQFSGSEAHPAELGAPPVAALSATSHVPSRLVPEVRK